MEQAERSWSLADRLCAFARGQPNVYSAVGGRRVLSAGCDDRLGPTFGFFDWASARSRGTRLVAGALSWRVPMTSGAADRWGAGGVQVVRWCLCAGRVRPRGLFLAPRPVPLVTSGVVGRLLMKVMMVVILNERARCNLDALISAIWAKSREYGLRMATLAERLGVHPTTVSGWVEDVPTVQHLICWAAAVGLRLEIEGGPAVDVPADDAYPGPALVATELSRLAGVLRLKREAGGRTQSAVAASLGVSETTVLRWERLWRVPYLAVFVAWSGDLGCSVEARAVGWPVEPEPALDWGWKGSGRHSTAARRARAGIDSRLTFQPDESSFQLRGLPEGVPETLG
jgi:transcriptional regulator with XRE-family HTH domain